MNDNSLDSTVYTLNKPQCYESLLMAPVLQRCVAQGPMGPKVEKNVAQCKLFSKVTSVRGSSIGPHS